MLYSNLLSTCTLLSTHCHEEKGKCTVTTSVHLILSTVTLLTLLEAFAKNTHKSYFKEKHI